MGLSGGQLGQSTFFYKIRYRPFQSFKYKKEMKFIMIIPHNLYLNNNHLVVFSCLKAIKYYAYDLFVAYIKNKPLQMKDLHT